MSLCTLAFISMSNLLPSLSGVFIIIFLGCSCNGTELTGVTDFLLLTKFTRGKESSAANFEANVFLLNSNNHLLLLIQ